MKTTARKIRIGLAQANPVVGDLAGNAKLVREISAEAKKAGVQILAFPELFLCGYPAEDLLLKPGFLADCEAELGKLARQTRGIAVIIGSPEPPLRRGAPMYNTASVLYRGKIAARYRKIHLPNYGVFDEKRYFTRGTRPLVVRFGDIPVGISICEDMWMDDGPTAIQTGIGGARIIINISASPYHRRKGPEREKLMQRRARENNTYLCYVNLLGGQDELVFDGSSIVCDPAGKTVARGAPFMKDLIVTDIRIAPGQPKKRSKKRLRDTTDNTGAFSPGPVEITDLPPLPVHRATRLPARKKVSHLKPVEEVYEALVTGTRDYVEKNGFTGVVLGISGGIDSALTAAIAVDALGPNRVSGVTMPSGYTSSSTLRDAWRLAENLGIRLLELPIDSVYDSYRDILKEIIPKRGVGITEENLQARVRGNLLMALSNKFGYLVLTTGNKSEIAVGYCTLYGDMAGGLGVLKDVPKTLVFSLSRYRNRVAGKALIPSSTIKRKPSAELRPDQCDQDTLPPYPVLDRIIELYVENDLSFSEIVSEGMDPSIVRQTIRMIDFNEYKRRQGPPGIRITPKAFGRDRRLPITNRYRAAGKDK